MLQKFIIKVKCIQTGTVKGNGGLEVHGWFFKWLQDLDPVLSEKVHGMDEKPFAVGPIYGGKKEKGKTILEAENEYTFSISSLNQEIYDGLWKLTAAIDNYKLQLGSSNNIVTDIQPILSEKLDYIDVIKKSKLGSDNINLQFCSPTSFRQQGTQELFPQPSLVFSSLLRKWNTFSPYMFPSELYLTDVIVSRYNLRTELVDFGKYKIIGCIGSCTYQLDKGIPGFQKELLHSLAFFAGIAGVGYKTSMGLGDARYLK